MLDLKNISGKMKRSYFQTAGVVIVLFLAGLLLWFGNSRSMQAMPAMVGSVYFDGEYRIEDGEWHTQEFTSTEWFGTSMSAHRILGL